MHYTLVMLAPVGFGSNDLISLSFFGLEMDFVASYLPPLENKLSSDLWIYFLSSLFSMSNFVLSVLFMFLKLYSYSKGNKFFLLFPYILNELLYN